MHFEEEPVICQHFKTDMSPLNQIIYLIFNKNKKITMKNILETKTYGKIIAILSIILIALIIFAAGIFVGYYKATFSHDLDDVYRQGFNNPESPFAPFMHGPDDINSHGVVGQIVSINLPNSIMIKGIQSAEW